MRDWESFKVRVFLFGLYRALDVAGSREGWCTGVFSTSVLDFQSLERIEIALHSPELRGV